MRAMQNPDIFPFYTYGTNVKLRTFQKYVLSKIRTFKILYFQKYVLSKIRTFQKYVLSKLRTFKILYFQKYVLSKIRTFSKIPYFLQNSVFLKNSPFQSSSRIPRFPQKNSVFFKIPRSKKVDFLQNSVFFS